MACMMCNLGLWALAASHVRLYQHFDTHCSHYLQDEHVVEEIFLIMGLRFGSGGCYVVGRGHVIGAADGNKWHVLNSKVIF